MSIEFSKDNLYMYLKELGKVFRKLNGTQMPAEIVLVGGGAILANYNFRNMTTDLDAIIQSSSVMKDAILRVSDKYSLPPDWLNTDFRRTDSYSDKLEEVSIYYRTFSNVLTVRTVAAEYLIAMKLMSGRRYKNDLSDIAGILWEHEHNSTPITKVAIERALEKLYTHPLPDTSKQLLDDIFRSEDYEGVYKKLRASENTAKEILLDFDKNHPSNLQKDSIDNIIDNALKRLDGTEGTDRAE